MRSQQSGVGSIKAGDGTAGQGSLDAFPHFGSTAAEELWASTATGPVCIGTAVVGDALTGSALALLLSDAGSLFLWPSAASIAPPVTHHTFYNTPGRYVLGEMYPHVALAG